MINMVFDSLYAMRSHCAITSRREVIAAEKEMKQTTQEPVTFTWSGALLGVRRSLALILSVCTYGVAFGVLARQTGLSLPEATLLSGASRGLSIGGTWTLVNPVTSRRYCLHDAAGESALSVNGGRTASMVCPVVPPQGVWLAVLLRR